MAYLNIWNNAFIGKLIRNFACVLCMIFLNLGVAYAESPLDSENSKKTLATLSEKSRYIKSLSISFNMDREVKLFSDHLYSAGKLFVLLPDFLRWETITPFASALILSGGKAVKFTKDQGEWKKLEFAGIDVIVHSLREILQWQRGDFQSAEESYALTVFSGPKITLEPKSSVQRKQISKIQLSFSPKTYLLEKVSLFEPGGDVMKITFSSVEKNVEIPLEKFSTEKFNP